MNLLGKIVRRIRETPLSLQRCGYYLKKLETHIKNSTSIPVWKINLNENEGVEKGSNNEVPLTKDEEQLLSHKFSNMTIPADQGIPEVVSSQKELEEFLERYPNYKLNIVAFDASGVQGKKSFGGVLQLDSELFIFGQANHFNTSVQRCELKGFVEALTRTQHINAPILFLTDSGYVATSVQNGWIYNDKESRAFQDLWSKATSLWKTSYKLVHVKAHAGISFNESADLVSKAYALEGLERSLYHLPTVLEDPSLSILQSWLKEKIGLQNGWIYNDKESRAFQDLWSKATSLWKTSYKLVHVKAHTGISFNESADLVSKAYALEGLERSLYHLSTVLEDPSLTTLQSWLKEKIGC
uniref:RNase H domain-containing protein n=1 Tax=Strongyloides venezuelensis TaxID=75913 RepID=A0A0K0F360_STRVS